MGNRFISKYHFFFDFLLKRATVAIPAKIIKILDKVVDNEFGVAAGKPNGTKKYFWITMVPGYLEPNFSGYTSKKIAVHNGSFIAVKNYGNAEDYFKTKFSSKRLVKYRRYERRLNMSFNIDYKMYYGNIGKDEFLKIMDKCKFFLSRRFEELSIYNEEIETLKNNTEEIYSLILNKECALFVIYNQSVPISIGLGLIHNSTASIYINAYDTNYSKFYLGLVNFHKQIDWYFSNQFYLMDLMVGRYEYKEKYADQVYDYYNYLVYPKNSFSFGLLAQFLFFFSRLRQRLIKLGKHLKIHKIYFFLKGEQHYGNKMNVDAHKRRYELLDLDIEYDSISLDRIDLKNGKFPFLLEPCYDFLYIAQEHIDNAQVYRVHNEVGTYIIKANETSKKIRIL